MQMQGEALRVIIYIGEDNRHEGKPLYVALLEFLRRQGAMGATVTRGIAGYGAHSRIHTASIIALSAELPIKVEWIDHRERVEALMPQIRGMVGAGLITVEAVEVIQYAAGRFSDPMEQPVRSIMRTAVTTVGLETPIAEVIQLLIDRGYRSLPVVDGDFRVAGIITDGDLIQHANLPARLGLYGTLSPDLLRAQFVEVAQSGATAQAIMAEPVVTIGPDDTLRKLAAKMNLHDLKRLPVVDGDDHLVGLATRLDLLRTLEYHGQLSPLPEGARPRQGSTISALMNTDPPTVTPQATLEEIVRALESSYQQRVLVVDSETRVVGIISDGDIVRRSQDRENPGLLDRLRGIVSGEAATTPVILHPDESAADLMTTPVFTIAVDTPLEEALRLMLRHQIKRLPVVNERKQLIGLLGRSSLLHGLVGGSDATSATA